MQYVHEIVVGDCKVEECNVRGLRFGKKAAIFHDSATALTRHETFLTADEFSISAKGIKYLDARNLVLRCCY